MNSKYTFISIFVSLLILVAGGVTFFVYGQKPEIATKDNSDLPPGMLVETVAVERFQDSVSIEVDGEAKTIRNVEVTSEVSGRVEYKYEKSRSGHFVPKDQLLFRIDDEAYQLKVDQQQAMLDQIDEEIRAINVELDNLSTSISLAQENLDLQRKQLARTQELYMNNAASETALDADRQRELDARDRLQTLKNNLALKQQSKLTAQANRKVAEVTLKQAEYDLARCEIRSPIDGRVIQDEIEEGKFVTAGQVLTRLSDSATMEVFCQLQMEELAWIWEAQVNASDAELWQSQSPTVPELSPVPCEVVYQFNGTETIWEAKLERFSGTGLSRDTRMIPAFVSVEAPDKSTTRSLSDEPVNVSPPTLVSGMFVTVRIPVRLSSPLLKVPVAAVRPGGKLWLNHRGTMRIVDVSVAIVRDEFALIRSYFDLSPGDRVIVSPLSAASDGMLIREETGTDSAANAPIKEEVQL